MSRVEDRSHYRLPAEWERQSALLLTWPNPDGAWSANLDAIESDYVALVEAALRHQRVVLLVPKGSRRDRDRLGEDRPGLHRIEARYNDTWIRDYGPITLCRVGQRLALDFHFGGWGGKHESGLDNLVNTHLARHPLFDDIEFRQCHLEIEGGAIECNGDGLLLVNRHCMRTRMPFLDDAELDHELSRWLNLKRVLGIDVEPLPGDDTDGHIDTLARFVRRDAIAFQSLADDAATRDLNGQLEALRDADGRPFELFSLPHPDDTDPQLPASYANFILINGAVLVPQYNSRFDADARDRLAQLFPDRTVEGVPGATLTTQGGGPHCASMQIPTALN
ncbi:agmatine deiminase family protein [Halomonas denitrificans]|nr:agmatine deiminase family protein [Halomonas denitrificans]